MTESEPSTYSEPVHESLFIFTGRIILLQLLIALISILIALLLINFVLRNSTTAGIVTAQVLSNILLQLLDAVLVVLVVLQWHNTSYLITAEEVIIRRGTFKMHTDIYNTADIKSIQVKQTVLGRLFDYGTLTFTYPSASGHIELVNIPRPYFYTQIVKQHQTR